MERCRALAGQRSGAVRRGSHTGGRTGSRRRVHRAFRRADADRQRPGKPAGYRSTVPAGRVGFDPDLAGLGHAGPAGPGWRVAAGPMARRDPTTAYHPKSRCPRRQFPGSDPPIRHRPGPAGTRRCRPGPGRARVPGNRRRAAPVQPVPPGLNPVLTRSSFPHSGRTVVPRPGPDSPWPPGRSGTVPAYSSGVGRPSVPPCRSRSTGQSLPDKGIYNYEGTHSGG